MQINSITAAVLFPREFLTSFQLTRKHVRMADFPDADKPVVNRSLPVVNRSLPVVNRGSPRGRPSSKDVMEALVLRAIQEGHSQEGDIAARICRGNTTVRSYARKLLAKGLIEIGFGGPKGTKFVYFPKRGTE